MTRPSHRGAIGLPRGPSVIAAPPGSDNRSTVNVNAHIGLPQGNSPRMSFLPLCLGPTTTGVHVRAMCGGGGAERFAVMAKGGEQRKESRGGLPFP
jgi:hypothetical protein